jgi:GNAT superfamily N-acetyltransferase
MTSSAVKNEIAPGQSSVTIVADKKDFKKFIEFPYLHYKGADKWIPPLRLQQKEILDVNHHPFFKDAEMALFIAEFNGKPAGRIAAIQNKAFNRFNNEAAGFFGFFECIDNQHVANLLFKVADGWFRNKGLTTIYGPFSPSMMGEIGVLIEGFDKEPGLMMPYNYPYYDKLILNAGYEKKVDLLAFRIDEVHLDKEKIDRADEIVKRRLPNLVIRDVNLKYIKSEAVIIRDIFNKAWAKNWGFAPVSEAEFDYLVKELRMIIDTDFAHIAEIDGQPVAFSISLPDMNQVFKKMNGKLFPLGIFKLLYYKNKIRQMRTALMGVLPEWQGKGIDTMMHQRSVMNGIRRGFSSSELSWLLETNTSMINVAVRLGAFEEKKYRVYKKQ